MHRFSLIHYPAVARLVTVLLALVVLAGAVLAGRILDGTVRQEAEAALSATFGMPVELNGAVRLGWLPGPALTVHRLLVRPAPNLPPVLLIEEARVSLSPAALWRGRLLIRDLSARGAIIRLHRDGEGRLRWGNQGLTDLGARLPLVPDQLHLVNSRLEIRDPGATSPQTLNIQDLRLGLAGQPAPFSLAGQWLAAGEAVTLQLSGVTSREGGLLRLEEAGLSLSYPVEAGQAKVVLRGDWMLHRGRVEVRRLHLDGQIQAGADTGRLLLSSPHLAWDGRFRARSMDWQLERRSGQGVLQVAGSVRDLGRSVANLYASFTRKSRTGHLSGDVHAVLGGQQGRSAGLDEVTGQILILEGARMPLQLHYSGQGRLGAEGLAMAWQGRLNDAPATGSLVVEGFFRPTIVLNAQLARLDVADLSERLRAVLHPDQCRRMQGQLAVAQTFREGRPLGPRQLAWHPLHCEFQPRAAAVARKRPASKV